MRNVYSVETFSSDCIVRGRKVALNIIGSAKKISSSSLIKPTCSLEKVSSLFTESTIDCVELLVYCTAQAKTSDKPTDVISRHCMLELCE